MKKLLVLIAVIIVVCCYHKEENIVIPNNAIRFRVIANSNTIEDQNIKNNVAKYMEKYIIDMTKDAKSSEEAKDILMNNHQNIEDELGKYLDANEVVTKYQVSIGRNYFPEKEYHGIKYDAGYYDSLVISLGYSQGLNWWCVMYPPLCLIDRNTTADDYEITSLTKELLEKYV